MMDIQTINYLNEIVAYTNDDGYFGCVKCVDAAGTTLEAVSRGAIDPEVSVYCEECLNPIRETLQGFVVRILHATQVALRDGPDTGRDTELLANIREALELASDRGWR